MKSLNKTLRALSYIFVLCILLSCELQKEVSMGLPSRITFQPEGGTKCLQADRVPIRIVIQEKKSSGFLDAIEDTVSVSYEWLTVKQNVRDAQMIFYAEPTNSTKKRKLTIELFDDPYYSYCVVEQKGMEK